MEQLEEIETANLHVIAKKKVYVKPSAKRRGHWRTDNRRKKTKFSLPDQASPLQANPEPAKAKQPPARPSKKDKHAGSKANPIIATSAKDAARHLANGKHVRLEQKEEVGTLLNELKTIVDDAKAKGESAPTYDLCKVSVPGTNLFCLESKGIPRDKMPQLSGKPLPGSKADKLPKNKKGEVDLTEPFLEHLKGLGINVYEEEIDSSHLRASQNQLNGGKVAGMAQAMIDGTMPDGRIFTSNGGYVVDGHHRWAAQVGQEYKEGGKPMKTKVRRLDVDILEALALSNAFAADMGIPQASVAKARELPCIGCSSPKESVSMRILI
jgi:hypothetical protein